MTKNDNDRQEDTAALLKSMAESVARLERKVDLLSTELAGVRREVGAVLYAAALEKMLPGALEKMLPKVDESWFAGARSLYGMGNIYAVTTMRDYCSRTLGGMGMFLCTLPADKAETLLREAVDVAPNQYKAVAAGYVLHFLRRRLHYSPERLLPECIDFQKSYDNWRPELKHIWAICIETHALAGNTAGAVELLDQYRRHYNFDRLGDVPLAARFARDQGVDDEYVVASAALADEVEQNNKSGFPESLAKGSIAIIGGGPQDSGRGRGAEIDAHDIVIRVNHIPADERLYKDYGAKIDVFSITTTLPTGNYAWPDPKNMRGRLKALMVPNSLRQRYYSPQVVREIMRYKLEANVNIIMPSDAFQPSLYDYQDYNLYSTGLCTIIWMKRLKPDLTVHDLYGFSHKEPFTGTYGYFYSSNMMESEKYSHHDMYKEREIFMRLFNK